MITCPTPHSSSHSSSHTFRTHLTLVEAGFTAPATTKLQTYLPSSGRKCSVIYHFSNHGTMTLCHYHIPDGTPLREVEEVVDVVTGEVKQFGGHNVMIILDTSDNLRERAEAKVTLNLEGRYREEHSLFDHYMFICPRQCGSIVRGLSEGYRVLRLTEQHVKQVGYFIRALT